MPHFRPAALLTPLLFAAAVSAPAPDDPHTAARSIYAASCASCHGEDLRGGGASSLADGVWLHGSGGQVRRSIAAGVPEAGMPAFGNELSDEEIGQLMAYMRHVESESELLEPALPDLIPTRDYDLRVTPVAEGLDVPWAIGFLDADTALVTERGGTLRLLGGGALHPDPIRNTPAVVAEGQGGLLDIIADPDYATNGWIYLSYSHALADADPATQPATMTRVVRGRIQDHTWADQEVVWEAVPDHYVNTRYHFGSRFAFTPDGHLYFGVGDRGKQDMAQDITLPNGKIHRVNPDGSVPSDNPFVNSPDGEYASLFTFGNRNPQGLATHPVTGRVWETEHGPQGGDELNLIAAGVNYGWPVISYGINYNGSVMTELTAKDGLQQPVLYWKPSIAACGLTFYSGDQFPRWKNNLFAGGLSYETVQRLVVVDDRVIYKEEILKNLGRVRDVQEGPDGAIYVVLNDPGTVIRLSHDATHPGPGDGNEANP